MLKESLLRTIYRLAPFNIKGDLQPSSEARQDIISCLICASNRPIDLEYLLFELSRQSLDYLKFEVVILNDGAGESVRSVVDQYRNILNIRYAENETPKKIIGQLRNETIFLSRGKYIFFLDDDTRILQVDFLEKALSLFEQKNPDVIIPLGKATFGIVKLKYDFFDPFSFGNAGCLYKSEILNNIGGFKNSLISYEDIDLGIRLTITKARILKTDKLIYFHPPFYFHSMKKPISMGQSILNLKQDYPILIWIMIYLNALRFLPYALIPNLRYQQWSKISLGVLLASFNKKVYYD